MRGPVAVTILFLTGIILAGCIGEGEPDALQEEDPIAETPAGPLGANVVVAQFDTGTNPFHPCFRRPGWDASQAGIPGFPDNARALNLVFNETYEESLEANEELLGTLEPGVLHHFPGTNLLFYGEPGEFVDTWPHGAQASSQVVCEEYGMAPDAWLVVLNYYIGHAAAPQKMDWVAEQDWIDIVHLNIQSTAVPTGNSVTQAIERLTAAGPLVVIAAGNGIIASAGGTSVGGVGYPMELSHTNGPPGSLIAGANSNTGYTQFSNMNPHVVMNGCQTHAAQPYGHGTTSFGGTSSASPRITGYTAAILQEIRNQVGHLDGRSGDTLVGLPADHDAPRQGPLVDGVLSVAELHEVVRRTADPNPHESRYNGDPPCTLLHQPAATPVAVYAKMGYGQVSEHTLPVAVDAILGVAPVPERPVEDEIYALSEQWRESYWG